MWSSSLVSDSRRWIEDGVCRSVILTKALRPNRDASTGVELYSDLSRDVIRWCSVICNYSVVWFLIKSAIWSYAARYLRWFVYTPRRLYHAVDLVQVPWPSKCVMPIHNLHSSCVNVLHQMIARHLMPFESRRCLANIDWDYFPSTVFVLYIFVFHYFNTRLSTIDGQIRISSGLLHS